MRNISGFVITICVLFVLGCGVPPPPWSPDGGELASIDATPVKPAAAWEACRTAQAHGGACYLVARAMSRNLGLFLGHWKSHEANVDKDIEWVNPPPLLHVEPDCGDRPWIPDGPNAARAWIIGRHHTEFGDDDYFFAPAAGHGVSIHVQALRRWNGQRFECARASMPFDVTAVPAIAQHPTYGGPYRADELEVLVMP